MPRRVAHVAHSSTAEAQRHARAEPDEQHEVAGLEAAGVGGLGQGERDRAGGGVAGGGEDVGDLRSCGMPSLAHGRVDDAGVGLVGDEQGDVGGGDAGLVERPLGRLDHDPHGPAEDLGAVHHDGAADVGVEQVAQRAVGAEVPAEQPAGSVAALEHDGAGAVAEEDGGAAVVPVDDRATSSRRRSRARARMPARRKPSAATRP